MAGARTHAAGEPVTIALAGDVNFSLRTATRLQADPATAFGVAAQQLRTADVTIVNLETAITERGEPAPKQFHFRAPATAFSALRAAGVDLATMANNHAADYGATGITDTVAAIAASRFPVIGFGADAALAYAPYETTINGQRFAIFAASQVHDYTAASWAAGAGSPGIAVADDQRLLAGVREAVARGRTVLVYLHWGTEYEGCPNGEQRQLADRLAHAGAAAVVGTHAHVLQGAGWRADGVYVAYGLGNYLWWKSFGNNQDDNGVLTLTFTAGAVTGAEFVPSRLDETGVPVPATGAARLRILQEWDRVRVCAGLAAHR